MKKIIFILSIISFIWIVYSINVLSYTNGAPVESTNAPGESSCGSGSFCHNGLPNTGSGATMLIPMEDLSAGYVPGHTYTIMPYVNQAGSDKIGFQTVALLPNGQGAGMVTITNSRTQVNLSSGKEYVTHSASGTTGISLMDWMYEWTAPAAGSGTVTVYGAFLASNNDMTTTGDSIYTDSLVIPENTTGLYESEDLVLFRINYHYGTGYLFFYSNKHQQAEIIVCDISGKTVYTNNLTLNKGKNSAVLNFRDQNAGIYIISLTTEENRMIKKFFLPRE